MTIISKNYIEEEIRRKRRKILGATTQKYFVPHLCIRVLKIHTTNIHKEPISYRFPEEWCMSYLLRKAIRVLVDSLRRRNYPLKILINFAVLQKNKGKGKAVPLQAWSGPEGLKEV